ncbi:unnamed protein product [Clavelina lepadiformis]|uniref:GOLD domain-containing protein n=1 Tax=Clavelina lepadiformis TaxID=159417 RepID=A0ABP0F0E3_CLALP
MKLCVVLILISCCFLVFRAHETERSSKVKATFHDRDHLQHGDYHSHVAHDDQHSRHHEDQHDHHYKHSMLEADHRDHAHTVDHSHRDSHSNHDNTHHQHDHDSHYGKHYDDHHQHDHLSHHDQQQHEQTNQDKQQRDAQAQEKKKDHIASHGDSHNYHGHHDHDTHHHMGHHSAGHHEARAHHHEHQKQIRREENLLDAAHNKNHYDRYMYKSHGHAEEVKKMLSKAGSGMMLQQYTLVLHGGRNCLHQYVLEDSEITFFYLDMQNKPIHMAALDSQAKILVEEKRNCSGTINIPVKTKGYYHFCFVNPLRLPRKLFIAFEIGPGKVKRKKYWEGGREGRLYLIQENLQEVNALLQFRKAKYSSNKRNADDYINIMNERSWTQFILVLLILALQVYAIHRVFDKTQSTHLKTSNQVQYRMSAKV